ncbi:MAG: tetratricopeptide repeat protein [Sulfuritalea sp.]|nr:tetratricopeptide repeat protein [Sulfuritalea sp.]
MRNRRPPVSASPQPVPETAARLFAQGRFAELEARARVRLKHDPQDSTAWKALGAALSGQGRRDEAVKAKQRAVDLCPDDAEAHGNLGNEFSALGLHAQAVSSYEAAQRLEPRSLPRWTQLGDMLAHAGRQGDAIRAWRQVAAQWPDNAGVWTKLGNALRDAGRIPEAEAPFRRALAIDPAFVAAANGLAITLHELGRLVESRRVFEQALSLAPDNAAVHSNLGNLQKNTGDLAGAQASYRRALSLQPDFMPAHHNLLLVLNYDPQQSLAACLAAAREFGLAAARKAGPALSTGVPSAAGVERPLRVGFVSGDLRQHPVGYFLEGWLAHCDPRQVELLAYPATPVADATTARLKPCFARWTPVYALSDEGAARAIAADAVDVLIDLSGHTEYNRLGIFAWHPAPVQVSWLGYFATTGLREMDAVLADPVVCPEHPPDQAAGDVGAADAGAEFTEAVWRLPRTRLCFSPPAEAPPVSPLPALKDGCITFGSFQGMAKITPPTLDAWARILAAVPGARLRLQNNQLGDPATAAAFAGTLQAHGIPPGRVQMHGKASRAGYLAAHTDVDLLLDTFPFPGGTTTCEALWMGVPTVTLAGTRMLSRQGAGLLSAAGLADWVAQDAAHYVALACAKAANVEGLAVMRAGLRQRLPATPLFDGAAFARDFQHCLLERCKAMRMPSARSES